MQRCKTCGEERSSLNCQDECIFCRPPPKKFGRGVVIENKVYKGKIATW